MNKGDLDVLWQHWFESDLGWIGVSYRERAIAALTFGWQSLKEAQERQNTWGSGEVHVDRLPASTDCRFTFARECRRRLEAYAGHGLEDLTTIPYVDPAKTTFHAAVIRACRGIRPGETLTYGELATVAGSPGASRAVGNCMARNPLPLLIPCHRVVAADGRLGGFSAPTGLSMKTRLLELEASARTNQGLPSKRPRATR